MNILEQKIHKIKQNDALYLNNQVFMYPPYQEYSYITPKNISEKVIYEYSDGMEGSPRDRTIEFKFPKIGEYTFEFLGLAQKFDETEITHTIKVICEKL